MFLDLFYYNENFALSNNVNPDKLINIKLIYKLVITHPETYESFNKILREENSSFLNEHKAINIDGKIIF